MTARFCIEQNVSWIVSDYAVDVFRENEPPVHLPYPEAALWDLLSRRSKRDALVKKLSLITERDSAATADWVEQTLAAWSDQNLIQDIG